eukprot:jgi/Picsp_1/3677/NSC_06514-R1_---NA---
MGVVPRKVTVFICSIEFQTYARLIRFPVYKEGSLILTPYLNVVFLSDQNRLHSVPSGPSKLGGLSLEEPALVKDLCLTKNIRSSNFGSGCLARVGLPPKGGVLQPSDDQTDMVIGV